MVIKSIVPASLAKISCLIYAAAGLVIGVIVTIGSIAGLATKQGGLSDVIFGIGAVIALPILYGVIGFVSSWLLAFVYNIAAKKVGGIQIDA
jgi:hypothetical protein